MTVLLAALLLLGAQDIPDEAVQSVRKLRVAPGLKVELFAAEPQFVNPVAFSIDGKGRVYVAETHRRHSSVFEVWDRREWLDADLASKTVEERVALYRKQLGAEAAKLEVESERIRILEDRSGKGRAEVAWTFAEGFNALADGLGSSVLARGGEVWFACAPNLWHLTVGEDGKAYSRKVLHYGFGVHMGSGAHDLHGLCFGPDGKLYFSMGDRGFHIVAAGKTLSNPDSGAVLRCNPDGTELEIVATGLRNPQQLTFDATGNLWTGDNNCDAGDKARWVWVVEGGDSGWRFGYQREALKSPWMVEKLWELDAATTAPSQVPAVGHVGHGPAGVAFYPGTGLSAAYDGRFFMADFPGSVRSFSVQPRGAGFEVVDEKEFLGELWPTDVKAGPDGAIYVSDWVQGWGKPGKGRLFRVFDPAAPPGDTRALLAAGMEKRPVQELSGLLGHKDQRVRLEAQFELAARKQAVTLDAAATGGVGLARLHGIWGLGQLGAVEPLGPLLKDVDAEVRAQAAKVLGDLRVGDGLIPLLDDGSPRVRFFAAIGLARSRTKEAVGPLIEMLRDNDNRDAFLRHAGVFALASIGELAPLLEAAKDESTSVRLAALLALRRLGREEIQVFLEDKDPALLYEAARAIYDAPIPAALPALARSLNQAGLPERVQLRAMNAAFRTGDLLDLAVFAGNGTAPLRDDVVQLLGLWDKPPGRDPILGLWRPLPLRKMRWDHRDGLLRILRTLIETGEPEEVVVQALRSWGNLQLGLCPQAKLTLEDLRKPSAVRLEALRTLAATRDFGIQHAVTLAVNDADPAVREEGVKLLVKLRIPDTAVLLERIALEKGSLAARQAAVASLGDWEGAEADGVLGRLYDRWDELPAGLHLELLEAAGKRPALKEKLDRRTAALAPNAPLLEGGDAKSGRAIFFERLDVSCARCHAVKDKGGTVGPPLTQVAAQRTREQLLESILLPNKEIVQGYVQTLLQMKDDSIEVGRIEKETDTEIFLVPAEGARKTLAKADVKARKAGLSAMSDDISKSLSKRDLRDLVAYLATLR